VTLPAHDFVEPSHYIFPLLNFEIGAVKNLLVNFWAFAEEELEVLSVKEKAARNCDIITDICHSNAKEFVDAWDADWRSIELQAFWVKAPLNVMAWCQGLSKDQVQSLNEQRKELDGNITALAEKLLEKMPTALSEAKTHWTKSYICNLHLILHI
jgi:hypothetical protein